MTARSKIVIGIVVGIAVVIQLVPVDRSNPPVEEEIPASDTVRAVLRESCYDCHSNETRWPWYAYVAPASWIVARDVEHAREHMNFSTWNRYDAEERADHLEEIWEEVEEGGMPLGKYLSLHPDARLTDDDRAVLRALADTVETAGDSASAVEAERNGYEDHEH